MDKTCKVCVQVKPIAEFYEAKGNLDRHTNVCRKCWNERTIKNRKNKFKAVMSYADELQRSGLTNDEIFARIAVEVEAWRFRAAPLSTRQLRRMIYG